MNKLNNETAKWITANTECDQTQLFSIRIVIKKKKIGNEMWKRLQCLRCMEINYTIMERLYVRNNMW